MCMSCAEDPFDLYMLISYKEILAETYDSTVIPSLEDLSMHAKKVDISRYGHQEQTMCASA